MARSATDRLVLDRREHGGTLSRLGARRPTHQTAGIFISGVAQPPANAVSREITIGKINPLLLVPIHTATNTPLKNLTVPEIRMVRSLSGVREKSRRAMSLRLAQATHAWGREAHWLPTYGLGRQEI